MLVRLRLEEIHRYWELIHDSLVTSMCPTGDVNPDQMNFILAELLSGRMQAWAVFNSESKNFSAMLVTSMFEDLPTKTKNFVLYSLTAYKPLTAEEYISSFDTLKKFARAAGCTRMIAYTENERFVKIMLKLAEQLGGKSMQFISIPLWN